MIDKVNLTLTEGSLYYVSQFTILIKTNKWFIYHYRITLLYWLLYYTDYFTILITLLYWLLYYIGTLLYRYFTVYYLWSDDEECSENADRFNETLADKNTTWLSQAQYGHKLYVPFFTSGALQILAAILLAAMFMYHKYIPEEDETEAIEKQLEEAIRPLEKLYQRRYTINIIDNRMPESRNASLKNKRNREAPRLVHTL